MLIRTLSIKNGVKTFVPESLFNKDGLRQYFIKDCQVDCQVLTG